MSEQRPAPEPNASPEEEKRQRIEAESALHELEQHHRLLVEGAKDFAIVGLDLEGRIIAWNEGAQRLLGYSSEDVLGRFFSFTFTATDQQARRPERELAEAWQSGSATDENWAVRRDGSTFWASGITTALREDTPQGYVKIFRDLTERRLAEQALAESEGRLRAALAAARMGTWLWDIPTDTEHLDPNLLKLLGLPPDARIDKLADFLRLVHPDDRSAVTEAFHRAAEEGAEINIEFRVVWADGSVHWLRDQGNVLRDAQGRPQSLAGACVDITERKAMEAALAKARDDLERRVEERTAQLRLAQQRALQAERLAAIGQTVAGLAHEGRNALQTIHASAELLKWRLQDQTEALRLLDTIEKAHDTLHHLFEDVRGYAAPIVLEPVFCTLGDVWRKAWTQAIAGLGDTQPQLEEQTVGVDLVCEVDPFRLGQVFRNIFDNSLAAGSAPVHLRVACTETELDGRAALRISLADNGPGLNAEQRRSIFDPFYTTKTHGTGLGMAIAKRIVEAHGGQLTVGEGTGPGAEIVVLLPRRRRP